MYKTPNYLDSSLYINDSQEGEYIEQKIARILHNKEPLTDGAPIIYTERKDGVIAAYNIRTDRFEVAVDAMDAVHRTEIGKRMERIKERETKVIPLKDSGAESTAGTGDV